MQPFTFFLSYRRADTAPVALLLKYEIEKRLRFVRAVVDVATIQPGESFPNRIRSLIDKSHATIALIGPRWMPRKDDDPSVWPGDGKDWVVEEISYSFTAPLDLLPQDRHGIEKRVVIPLFIGMRPDFGAFRLPPEVEPLTTRHAEHLMHESWPGQIGTVFDNIATTYELRRRPEGDKYPKPDKSKARTQPMMDEELRRILAYDDYEGWYVDNFGNPDVNYIAKSFKFDSFELVAEFMRVVSKHCSTLDHHPEWRNVYKHVTVALTTWDARRRVTIFDLNLALFMNRAAAALRAGKTL